MSESKRLSLAVKDRIALAIALGGIVALSWWYLIQMARHMDGMDMSMQMTSATTGVMVWDGEMFLAMFLMWAIMMVAMMVPTAFRSILIFASISEQRKRMARSFVPTLWFTLGYALAWTGFSLGATLLQWQLDEAALLSPHMVLYSPSLGALAVIFTGLWQLSPVKDACLRHCQTPAIYLAQHFRPGQWGAVRLGVLHGLYCLGCCWVLMGLLFVGGVMNLIWILVITLFVLLEKLLPPRLRMTPLSGIAMVLGGVGYLLFLAWNP